MCIDTAVVGSSVCLADGREIRGLKQNAVPGESAAWLHVAIQQLLQEGALSTHQVAAVAVSAGPGSYTGLRVGMAAAKGLCFALGIPLITINTLQMMAAAAVEEPTDLLCPMIDARRMEVFTGLFTKELVAVQPAHALILEVDSFANYLNTHTITFFGNGSAKFQPLTHHINAFFKTIAVDATHIANLAYEAFHQKKFADLAYSEPFYGKDFYSPAPRH